MLELDNALPQQINGIVYKTHCCACAMDVESMPAYMKGVYEMNSHPLLQTDNGQ